MTNGKGGRRKNLWLFSWPSFFSSVSSRKEVGIKKNTHTQHKRNIQGSLWLEDFIPLDRHTPLSLVSFLSIRFSFSRLRICVWHVKPFRRFFLLYYYSAVISYWTVWQSRDGFVRPKLGRHVAREWQPATVLLALHFPFPRASLHSWNLDVCVWWFDASRRRKYLARSFFSAIVTRALTVCQTVCEKLFQDFLCFPSRFSHTHNRT